MKKINRLLTILIIPKKIRTLDLAVKLEVITSSKSLLTPNSMIKKSIDAECTGQFSTLFLDYLAQKPNLHPFYNTFPKIENFKSVMDQRSFDPETRKVLVKALADQYGKLGESEVITSQIAALGRENTFTVTTGHQLNLFTGPLYFIYKIVTTINLAEQLKANYPDYHFVPVYWMATEDHDFEEINYFKLDGKKYSWNSAQTGAVGDFTLDNGFADYLKTVPFAPDFFKEAYTPGIKLSQAVRKYVHHLFGEKGLVVVDGHDSALKKLFIPVLKADLFENLPHQMVSEQTGKLEELGYKSQIYPREINLFYLENGLRERIEKRGEEFLVLNTDKSFSREALEELVDSHPESFSPNVVLRPLYQETILPNLAYIGGPAEVVYWLQLKSTFDSFKLPFPVVMPRNFAVVLGNPIVRKINKLGLSTAQLFEEVAAWKKDFVASQSSLDVYLTAEKQKLAGIFDESADEVKQVDQSLQEAFMAAKTRSLKIIDHLAGKVRKAEERKVTTQIQQREEVQRYLFPGGSPQERVENFMKFYLDDPLFLDCLFDLFEPLDFKFMILSPDE